MNSHPSIVLTDELRVVAWLAQEARKLAAGHPIHGDPYPFNGGKEFAQFLSSNAGTILRPFYETLARRLGKRDVLYWGDKYPHYHSYLPFMAKAFPRARYLFIHRDLRDVVCSVIEGHKWKVGKSSEYVAEIYCSYIDGFGKQFQQGAVEPESVIHLKYEELVVDFRTTAVSVFKRLGLEWSEPLLEELEGRRNIHSHSVRKAGKGNALHFDFQKKSVGRWNRDLSETDIRIVEAVLESVRDKTDIGERMILASLGIPLEQ
jgi:hypothetical protein